jgi:hypothetical protein
LTPDQLLSALRHFDVRIHEHSGWRTRSHGTLNARSIMVHDSVTGSMDDERAANFCAAGRSDLKGPLYEALIGRDGVCHLIAHGVTWNAGKGNAARLTQARKGQMPLDRELGRPASDDTSIANREVHGLAFVTAGAGPYTDVQRAAGARVVAAYAKAEGWTPRGGAGSVIGHGEYSRRKVDPQLDMGDLRRKVEAALSGGGGGGGAAEQHHTVVAGDTLFAIARKYSTDIATIKRLNNLTENDIRVGQRLRVR